MKTILDQVPDAARTAGAATPAMARRPAGCLIESLRRPLLAAAAGVSLLLLGGCAGPGYYSGGYYDYGDPGPYVGGYYDDFGPYGGYYGGHHHSYGHSFGRGGFHGGGFHGRHGGGHGRGHHW